MHYLKDRITKYRNFYRSGAAICYFVNVVVQWLTKLGIRPTDGNSKFISSPFHGSFFCLILEKFCFTLDIKAINTKFKIKKIFLNKIFKMFPIENKF